MKVFSTEIPVLRRKKKERKTIIEGRGRKEVKEHGEKRKSEEK
jgi:hypothetical protein